MLKRFLFLSIALCSAIAGAFAQRSYTFNAVALNVDGLPNEIYGISINPDGKEAAGATELCGILAKSGWDIVGFSEDFNFHDYLVAAPASTYYNFGEHGGEVSGLTNSTDGLGFACSKIYSMSGGTRVGWESYYGGSGVNAGDNGADGMIDKGFRFYTVTLATGVAVDVYVLHMDANTADSDDDYDSNGKDKNIAAREAQLTQLATHIKNNHNGRPVIVIGDTNCRYTREAVKTGFIDVLNADSRFTIKDAWVEKMWGGTYPTYGSDAMMTHTYGDQKGEVVDKIFYINTTESSLTIEANSYLHDTSVGVSDHYPVVVNFTVTDKNATPLTDEEKLANWTLEEIGDGNMKPTWEGDQVVSGNSYYLMNVGTGEYVKVGASYQTQATSGYAGHPITVTSLSNGKYALQTLGNSRGNYITAVEYPYMDGTESESHEWTLTPINTSSGSCQYYIEGGNGVLTATSEVGKILKTVAKNAADDKQKWVFLTDAKIRTEMAKANSDYPFNFTPLLKSADFDKMEHEAGYASDWTGFSFGGVDNGADAAAYNHAAVANSAEAVTASHSLGTLPGGNYNVSFEGFYRSRFSAIVSTKDETLSAIVSFGSTNIDVPQNTSTAIGAEMSDVAAIFRDNDTYLKSKLFALESSTAVTLSVTKPKTGGYFSRSGWICIDNFRLVYYGTGEVVVDPYKDFKNTVCAKVNETYAKVIELNEAGQAAYDISMVISRFNNNQITTEADADNLCAIVDKAYENAYAAHLAPIVKTAVSNMAANGGDITAAIQNSSFETGDLTGWTTIGAWDLGAKANSDGTYTTSDCDGSYLFNAYSGDDGHTSYVRQTIMGIPNGLYELKAKVTSFENRYVYITGNDYHTSVKATDKAKFEEATLYFLVVDGSATIGAIGGNKGSGTEFIHYWRHEGCFFKADNFRLKYICDVPHGRLKLALDEANAALDSYGKAALNISAYQTVYDNKSLSGDGKSEAAAVIAALQAAAKAQRTVNADMTWAISNPSFETGDYAGWTVTAGGDTKVAAQESSYDVAGANGRYLFNTWSDGGVAASHISQTVTGIPNGTYRLTAMLSSDAGNSLVLKGNGVETTVAASANGHTSGVFPAVECEVTDGTLAIEAGGVDDSWFKCDDFRLTYLGHHLDLNESTGTTANDWYTSVDVARTLKPGNWNTFVLPFSMAIPSGWEVKALTGSAMTGENISMVFEDAKTIEAGVPYMVRVSETVSNISVENVEVATALKNSATDHIEFIGVYESGYVPQWSFFISSNKFYRAAKANNNKIKAFRAYLKPLNENSEAKTLSYSFDAEDTTGVGVINSAEATIVGIYTLDGKRISDMQQGVNILKMSDGKVMKVIIK